MSYLKSVLKYVFIFILTFLLLLSALLAVAKIPKSLIYNNMLESAEYLNSIPSGNYLIESIISTRTDQFADTLLLNIAFHYDESNALESVIWSKFAGYPNQYAAKYFLESVRDGAPAEQEYLRYWHGSNEFVRLWHLFLNLKQIYICHAILMAALFIFLLRILWRNGLESEAVCLFISLLAVSAWVVPFCLEYTWVFFCMLVASIIAVQLALSNKDQWLGCLFLITGMVTIFLDFLTTETLSLLIPLLLVLRIRERRGESVASQWILSLKSSILWLIGYCGMWISKWVLASVVLHQDVMPYVTGHIAERQGGSLLQTPWSEFAVMLQRNILYLFPFNCGLAGATILVGFLIVLLIPVYQGKVQLRVTVNMSMIALYAGLMMVPVIRFFIMHSHSYGHAVFTHRALASTVMAICCIAMEMVEFSENRKILINQDKWTP